MGVLVHSEGALPGAAELIERMNRSGKPYFILTNDAARLPITSAARFKEFGLAIPSDRVITSGQLLRDFFAAHKLAGTRCVVLGPPESYTYVQEAGGRIVSPREPFDALVITDERGFPFFETLDAVLTSLYQKLDSEEGVYLVLPNPDVICPKPHGYGVASGGVAAMFEAAIQARYPHRTDARFVPLGKPEAAIFPRRCAEARRGTWS